jgi:hypothetical protein
MPVPVDDFYIYPDRIQDPSDNTTSLVAGPNLIANIYITSTQLTSSDTIETVSNSLNALMESAPASLVSSFGPEIALDIFMEPKERRQLQIELTKTTVRICWLSCRAAILTHFEASADKTILRNEWTLLASDAKAFLKEMPTSYVEPQAPILIPQLKSLSDSIVRALAENDDNDIEATLSTSVTENAASVAMRVAELQRDVLSTARLGVEEPTIALQPQEESIATSAAMAVAEAALA